MILQETALSLGLVKSEVTDIINFYTKYTAEVIKAGLYQGVSFPHFGKIVPKVKQIQYKAERRGLPKVEVNSYTRKEDDE